MPIRVEIGKEIIKVEMPGGKDSANIPEGVESVIDPDKWITMADV